MELKFDMNDKYNLNINKIIYRSSKVIKGHNEVKKVKFQTASND